MLVHFGMGPRLLSKYIADNGLTQDSFGSKCGILQSQVYGYMSGRCRPGIDAAIAIEQATNGKVPARSWRKRRNRRIAA
jgi:transcriptional regulator with XRE-family HTH domain